MKIYWKTLLILDDTILAATEKYKKQPSILKIIEKAKLQNQLFFKQKQSPGSVL